MGKVPKMISIKDLAYIEDIFNWNMTLVNKMDMYVDDIEDEEISQEFETIIATHQKICEELVKILREDT